MKINNLFVFWGFSLLLASCGTESRPSATGQAHDVDAPTKRVFDFVVSDYRSLPDHDPETLFNPGYLGINDGNLYVIDYGDKYIKRYSLDGKLLNTILEGQGEGPGEVQNPTALDFVGDDVWVLDPNPRKAMLFKKTGEFVEDVRLPELALRMIRVDERFVLLTLMNSELFTIVNDSGRVVQEFGREVNDLVENVMALDGWLFRISEDFIYVPRLFGAVYRYDKYGKLLGSFRTIEGADPPDGKTDVEQGGRVMRPPDAEVQTMGVSLYGDELILYTRFKKEQLHGFPLVVDRYSLEDGQYIGSIGVPVKSSGLAFYGDSLFVLMDSLAVFTVERPKG